MNMEIGDDPMLCHLCDQDIAGSEIIEHLRVEHGGGVSAVSPDEARKLRSRLAAIAQRNLDDRTITPGEARALLSALDALEQAGGGQADSGGTAEPCPVVGSQECYVVFHHREADAVLSLLEWALNKGVEPGVGLRREDAEAAGVKIELAARGVGGTLSKLGGDRPDDGSDPGTPGVRLRGTAVPSGAPVTPCALPTSDCRQAVAPKASNVPAPPPSVEALEADPDWREQVREGWQAHADLEAEMEIVEAGRDQAIKECDRLAKALRELRCPSCRTHVIGHACIGSELLALAGVPGGPKSEGQDLGGTAAQFPVVKGEKT